MSLSFAAVSLFCFCALRWASSFSGILSYTWPSIVLNIFLSMSLLKERNLYLEKFAPDPPSPWFTHPHRWWMTVWHTWDYSSFKEQGHCVTGHSPNPACPLSGVFCFHTIRAPGQDLIHHSQIPPSPPPPSTLPPSVLSLFTWSWVCERGLCVGPVIEWQAHLSLQVRRSGRSGTFRDLVYQGSLHGGEGCFHR